MSQLDDLRLMFGECWRLDVEAATARAAARRIGGRTVVNVPMHTVTVRWRATETVSTWRAVPAEAAHDLVIAVAVPEVADDAVWWRGVRGDGALGQLHIVRVAEVAAVSLDAPTSEDPT